MPDNNPNRHFIDRRTHRLWRRIYAILHAGLIDLEFDTLVRRVMQLEMLAFAGIVLAVWAGELWDAPHMMFHAPQREPNIYGASLTTAWVFFVMLLVLVATRSLLKQVRYLEGFLPVCSFCKKIRVEESWVPIEHYLHERSDVKMTHSLCPPCAMEHYGYEELEEEAG